MTVVVPNTLAEAIEVLAREPDATPLAGGTDLLVEINEGHRRPRGTVVAVDRIAELTTWTHDPVSRLVRLGAAVTWAEIEREPLVSLLPALAEAARTVGSPQIRNAGTVGGNLATCSPAGDGLPVLSALGSTVHLVSSGGRRSLSVDEFMVGVKRTALEPGEIIEAIDIPLIDGWQGYSKVGVRNAMVIATVSACVVTDGNDVRIALGSVAPTIIRCPDAEAYASAHADWQTRAITDDDAREAGRLAADASRPIDDHRSSAAYRRHAAGVLVARLLRRAFPGARR